MLITLKLSIEKELKFNIYKKKKCFLILNSKSKEVVSIWKNKIH